MNTEKQKNDDVRTLIEHLKKLSDTELANLCESKEKQKKMFQSFVEREMFGLGEFCMAIVNEVLGRFINKFKDKNVLSKEELIN